ncbi:MULTISPECIES: STM4504/CBY_0614 family protein [Sorangium]|uniref:STM4504/CBY_0614 family protein n=1 Tax=Sorangium TaxID=39643 RepID=UPI003D9C1587
MAYRPFFSLRRKQAARAGSADVYTYDQLPKPLRIQIIHIWADTIAEYRRENVYSRGSEPSIWRHIEKEIAEAHGVFRLGDEFEPFHNCQTYFTNANFDLAADMIELTFSIIEDEITLAYERGLGQIYGITRPPWQAIDDLNSRFREHAVGYQYTGGQLVRVDSQYVHAEAVKGALSLLREQPQFAGPEQEFLKAHEHYRRGHMQEAVVEALKAFESTIKVICSERGWKHDPRAAAKDLIKIALDNELVPRYLETHFAGLRMTLEAGLPTVRNKTSGHGQGATPVVLPSYFAAYALHLTATNIVFLAEAHKAKK